MIKYRYVILLIVGFLFSSSLYAQTISPLQQGRLTSIRGLSVVTDSVAWISGSQGTIAKTTDGGKNWEWQQIKGYEKADFRDIEAFSAKEAVIMGSGTPALVLKTTDGGISWQRKYSKIDSAYFLDAMDFTDENNGWILGDPIAGKLLLLNTKDGGNTWHQISDAPAALTNEASFAASGTCLRTQGSITIVTGGGNSRLLTSPLHKIKWSATSLPLTTGKPSQGAFSFAVGRKQTVVVGGDYVNNFKRDSIAYILPLQSSSVSGRAASAGPAGFQSCVEYLGADTYLSTGTSGSNFTTDGGVTWQKISDISYNVCRKAKRGKLVLLAGDGGRIGICKF